MDLPAIRHTLTNNGVNAAERQLALVGDNHGDEQLAILVQEMTPAEVSQFLSESDYTKPSVVAHHVTPDQFIGAIHRIGSRWGTLRGADEDTLGTVRSQLSDFILSALLHGEDGPREELFAAILEDALAQDALATIAIGEPGCPDFLLEQDWAVTQPGTWQEAYAFLHEKFPVPFGHLRQEVIALFKDRSEDEDEDKPDEDKWTVPVKARKFVRRTLQSLVSRAEEVSGVEPTVKPSGGIFDNY